MYTVVEIVYAYTRVYTHFVLIVHHKEASQRAVAACVNTCACIRYMSFMYVCSLLGLVEKEKESGTKTRIDVELQEGDRERERERERERGREGTERKSR